MQQFLGRDDAILHRPRGAAHALHAQSSHAAPVDLRQDLLLKAMKAGVERVQGHLHRVERITEIEHL